MITVDVPVISACARTVTDVAVQTFSGVNTSGIDAYMSTTAEHVPAIRPATPNLSSWFYCPQVRTLDISRDLLLSFSMVFIPASYIAAGASGNDFTFDIYVSECIAQKVPGYDPLFDDPGAIGYGLLPINGTTTYQHAGFFYTHRGYGSVGRTTDMNLTIPSGIITTPSSAMLLLITASFVNASLDDTLGIFNVSISGEPRWIERDA